LKSFGYLRDRLFLFSSSLYALNSWILKPRIHSFFLRNYFNDLLLIPCALPVLLLIQRRVGLRGHNRKPEWNEIFLNLFVWSIVCEWIGPRIFREATGDPFDVAAYAVGALVAGCWWQGRRGFRAGEGHEF
jgi:hypothetical protein